MIAFPDNKQAGSLLAACLLFFPGCLTPLLRALDCREAILNPKHTDRA